MIYIEDFKKKFDQKKWKLGKQIYTSGSVEIQKIEDGYFDRDDSDIQVVQVEAIVKTEKGFVQVSLSMSRNRIYTAECSCTEFQTSNYYYWKVEYCKHIVAVLFKASEQLNREKFDWYTGWKGRVLIDSYTRDAVVQVKNAQLKELVEIEPCLNIVDSDWSVSFKIGYNKKYVIKNVTNFCKMVLNKERYSYGKDFEILHSEEVFSENSKRLLSFIMTRVEEAKMLSEKLRYGQENLLQREIPLTKHNIDEFLGEMIGESIQYVINTYVNHKIRGKATITQKTPKLTMDITPDYQQDRSLEGVRLKMNAENVFVGNKATYQLLDDTLYISDESYAKILNPLLKVFVESEKEIIKIGTSLVPSFYHEVLPQLKEVLTVNEVGKERVMTAIPDKAELSFYFDINDEQAITCKVRVICGEQECSFYREDEARKYSYMLEQSKVIAILDPYIESVDAIQEHMIFHQDEETVFEFIQEGINQLTEIGEVHVTDKFKNLRVRKAPKISIGVQLKSDLLDLQVSTEDFDMLELADILKSYKAKKKYHRLKDGGFLNIQDDSVSQLAELVEGLHLSAKELIAGKAHLPAYRALYIDKVFQENQGMEYERNQAFKSLVRDFKSIEEMDYEVPSELKNILRNYQKVGYRWLRLLKDYQLGGILADDMGLGKTLQIITLLLALRQEKEKGTTLVVSPASLVYNWESEFEKFAPSLKIGVAGGTPAQRSEVIENYKKYDVVITSYDLLKRDIAEYQGKKFLFQIIDEAQYIKNHSTQVAKSVKIVEAKHKLALTGTPIENKLSELWSIFDYLMPGYLYPYEKFRKEIEIPIVKNQEEQVSERLRKLVSPFILRRLKKDVLKDLPDKLEETTYAKMDKVQEELYTAYVSKVKASLEEQVEGEVQKNKLKILAELTRLRQICCDPHLVYDNYTGTSAKLETCMELIQNAKDSGHKVLLFSQFTTMLEIIAARLTDENITYYEITGATPKSKRLQLVEAFNKDDTPIFLISLKAGGTGLNLTGADVVIHYDPWWNIAAQNQATDRAHRIGQENVVTVFQLIAKDTIEEKIVKMQEAKKQLADQIITGEENQLMSMGKEEFIQLLESE